MKLSEKRIELRKANGWSQEDLAEKVDARGRRIFGAELLLRILTKHYFCDIMQKLKKENTHGIPLRS